MLRKRIWDVPLGLWIGAFLFGLLCYLLRAFFIDWDDVRHAAALAGGLSRADVEAWHGHRPLGLLPLWLVTTLLGFVMPGSEIITRMQVIGAVSVALLGVLLYRWLIKMELSGNASLIIVFLFYFANATMVAATMMGQWSLNALFFANLAFTGALALKSSKLAAGSPMRLGLLAGFATALNALAAIPAVILGVFLSRKGGSAYWGSFLALTLVAYLGVWAFIAPEVELGGLKQPKPSIISWVITGRGANPESPPNFSGFYFRLTAEQVQNFVLPLGRPIRERDFWQYSTFGTFNMILKVGFGLTLLIAIGMLFAIRSGQLYLPLDENRLAARWYLGGSLLLLLLAILLGFGDLMPAYYWLWLWMMMTLGAWLAGFEPEEQSRAFFALTPLVIILGMFGLQKAISLRQPSADPERQLIMGWSQGLKETDIIVAGMKIVDWIRYYSPQARVISLDFSADPRKTLSDLIQESRQQGSRLSVWDFALDGDLYINADYAKSEEWQKSLVAAKTAWDARKPGLFREYSSILFYPTEKYMKGSIRFLEGKP